MLLQIWGKYSSERKEKIHPLLFHLLDVAMVVRFFWRHCFHSSLKRLMAGSIGLSEEDGEKWLVHSAGLHDIGKACPPFQGKKEDMKRLHIESGLVYPKFFRSVYHGPVTARVLPDLLRDHFDFFDQGKGWVEPLSYAVAGHHGQFPTPREVDINEISLGRSAWNEIRRDIFLTYSNLLEMKESPVPQSTPPPAFFVVLAGLTSVADWIASAENHFPMAGMDLDPGEYLEISQKRAEEAVRFLGWTGWKPPAVPVGFEELFPEISTPRPLQRYVADIVWKSDQPRLLIIEAPMGEGKTEAAMQQIESWSADLGRQGCYFALPTQAAGNQMFTRVRDFLARCYPRERVNLQLLHGRAAFSEDFQRLRFNALQDFENREGGEAQVVAEAWFTPKKRGLLAPFGVGTVDQIMLAVLKTRHVFVRLFALAGNTVIIDEVHAYDIYMSNILERLLQWFRMINTSVILLSATLPARKRRALLRAFTGCGFPIPDDLRYPRIMWVEGERAGSRSFDAYKQKRFHLLRVGDDPRLLGNELNKALAGGGAAAVVCNTVNRAQETYQALKKTELGNRAELFLFHARFPLEERLSLEDRVLSLFGKNFRRPTNRRLVLVATQLIEQSLDIDFDLLVTDLAPVDLVMQRAGRAHRHDRERPAGLEKPIIRVRVPEMDESGLPDVRNIGPVYDRGVMLRSYLALQRDIVELPRDMDEIIEFVYGEYPDLPEIYREALMKAEEDERSQKENDIFQAQIKEIPEPIDTSGSVTFWLSQFNGNLEEDDPQTHRSLQAQTRLGPPSVQVVCLHQINGALYTNLFGTREVDYQAIPDRSSAADIIMREITISHQGLVREILEFETPEGWRKNPMLRYHKPVVFENGHARVGNYSLELHPELGLVIRKAT